jgi:hypothetical protein
MIPANYDIPKVIEIMSMFFFGSKKKGQRFSQNVFGRTCDATCGEAHALGGWISNSWFSIGYQKDTHNGSWLGVYVFRRLDLV